MTLGRPAGQQPGEPKSFLKVKQKYILPPPPHLKNSSAHEGHRSLLKEDFVLYLHYKLEVVRTPNISQEP